ncbi:hypothetical protein MUK42_37348 [Musa troglodytarum]|uniref:Uncharacterized protein n=1 Tax=Musa troglodytarum TaxID=320322 RepID=A0A9E7HAM3_9LILI|nr:hypothetical protein MUK42_37348 [Musa troglodytarum]
MKAKSMLGVGPQMLEKAIMVVCFFFFSVGSVIGDEEKAKGTVEAVHLLFSYIELRHDLSPNDFINIQKFPHRINNVSKYWKKIFMNGQQKDETSVKKNMKKKSKGVNVDGELIAKDKPLEVAVDRNEATEPATEKNKKHKLEEQQ